MSTEQLYFDDPMCLEFTAEVTEVRPLTKGQAAAILPRTYFYPTSGGQEHDTGWLGDVRVLDVAKDDDGVILHVLAKSLLPGLYPARIDRARRLAHMQHHTAQHILSRAFIDVLDLETVSANINGATPSTIDLAALDVPAADLPRVEAAANAIVFADRAVKIYYIDDSEIASIPFRRAPKVSGRIRVVEVEGQDYSACGGTHCPRTGMVGLIKVLKVERQNQKARIHFVAGSQALEIFRQYQEVAQGLAALLDIHPAGALDLARKQAERLKLAQAELETLRAAVIAAEARRLAAAAPRLGNCSLVRASFPGRPAAELRALGSQLSALPGVVAVLAAHDGQKLALVAACAAEAGLSARDLLAALLPLINARGGGDASLAQGGGPAPAEAAERVLAKAEELVTGKSIS